MYAFFRYLYRRSRLKFLGNAFSLALDYIYDFLRFLRFSGLDGKDESKACLEGWILKDAHRIEKGLIASPSREFGTDLIDRYAPRLAKYLSNYGITEISLLGLATLRQYRDFHLRNKFTIHEPNRKFIEYLLTYHPHDTDIGGVLSVSRKDLQKKEIFSFSEFFNNRHSVRTFSQERVSTDEILDAIDMARKTPSVCNRQHWRVRIFDGENKRNILEIQNGNSSFRDEIDKVLLVTSDLNYFSESGERNQGYIDGGLFSMSLVLALHGKGLGTCMLNWSRGRNADIRLRKIVDIAKSEVAIMMIAVGHMKNDFIVAKSHRRNVEEIVLHVDDQRNSRSRTCVAS